MALAAWNPLKCSGTALPVNLLLCAKLIALTLLITGHVRLLPAPFLPFIPILDSLPPAAFQHTLQAAFVISAVALLFNRSVRLSSLILGGTILLGVLASKAYYGNNKTFCGCILVLIGLYQPGRQPWLLRYQLVIVYLGAGLNKLLDADWRSGVFFENWAVHRLHQPVYLTIAHLLPPMALARIMSWMTIGTELGLSVVFQIRRLYRWGIYASLLLHSGMLFFTGTTFTMFFYAMSASMLVFVEWPSQPLIVLFDGECGLCRTVRRWMEKLDFDGAFAWVPYQAGGAKRYGVPEADAERRLHLVNGCRIDAGFVAIKKMLLYNPVTYLAMAAVIAAPRANISTFRMVTVAVLLVVFLPPFEPVGQMLYDLVARNRRKLMPRATCRIG
jgi:predicted DCC family thiol-disulfide oxidoreductase YuxK